MSDTKAKGRKAADPTKPRRPQGPRKLYLILNEGADKAAVRAAISEVTFNGRKLLDALASGDKGAEFLLYKIEVEPRGGEGEAS